MTTTTKDIGQKELPAGWKWVKLEDVATLENGDRGTNYPSRTSFVETGIPFINAGHLRNGLIDLEEMNFITQERFGLLSNGKIQAKDFLFCLRGSLGKYGSVGDLSEGAIASSLVIIRCEVPILHDFMNAYLGSHICQEMISSSMNGAAQPNLSAASVKQFTIPLPPLGEQKRIAGILNEQMAAVEEAKKAAQERLEAAKALPAAYLREVFPSSEDELPAGWKWVKLGDVCEVVSGATPKSDVSDYWNGDIIWITPTDLGQLTDRYLLDSQRKITEAGLRSCSAILIPENSVVMSSRAPIGHLAISSTPLCTNQGCKSFVPRDQVDSEFLYHCLQIQMPNIQALGSGATFKEVSKSQMASFPIPLPPLEEQKRIASELDDKIAGVKLVEASIQQELDTIEAIPAALLRKAFSGGL